MIQRAHKRPKVEVASYKGKRLNLWGKILLAMVLVGALAFGLDMPILLLPLGVIYWAEILSVVLQVAYFKRTHGKRLFKMSPIRHHFEMCGWSEVKICLVLGGIALLGGVLGLAAVVFGV